MRRVLGVLFLLSYWSFEANGQNTEYYAGNRRSGVDLLWFRNFRTLSGGATPCLFFSRNRASADNSTGTTAWGSTQAVSYNFQNGLGFVAVAAFDAGGFTPKLGMQWYKRGQNWMIFSWLVADLNKRKSVDFFGMLRYEPVFTTHWKGFFQIELFPVFPTNGSNPNLTERFRIGAKYTSWGFGLMSDWSQSGSPLQGNPVNSGLFMRYDF